MSRDDDLFGLVRFFDDMFEAIAWPPIHYRKDLAPKYSCSSFPPVNVVMKQNKDLDFEFALAGYPHEDINVEFNGDYMTLKAVQPNKSLAEGDVQLYSGLKSSRFEVRYFVPADKYETEKASAEWKDGLLKIKIPSKEKQEAKKLTILKV